MRRILYVGDPHVTPEELGDCHKLLDYVATVARERMVDEVCFLGDQHHTHAVLRLEVVGFWLDAFAKLSREVGFAEVVCVVGNHDMPGDSSSVLNAMMCYGGAKITVVDRPMVRHGVLHLPYYHDAAAFVRDCKANETGALVCHQTFDGSKYENGFPARDGVEPKSIPQFDVLSGHIHTQQEVVVGPGHRIWYPGTGRWRIASDENVEKGIWLVERGEAGLIASRERLDTSTVCRARYYFKLTPDMPMHEAADADQAIHHLHEAGHKVSVDIEGPGEWVDQQIADLPQGLLVRAQRVQKALPAVRESEGIEKSFKRFLEGFQPLYGTPPERLATLAQERFGV